MFILIRIFFLWLDKLKYFKSRIASLCSLFFPGKSTLERGQDENASRGHLIFPLLIRHGEITCLTESNRDIIQMVTEHKRRSCF